MHAAIYSYSRPIGLWHRLEPLLSSHDYYHYPSTTEKSKTEEQKRQKKNTVAKKNITRLVRGNFHKVELSYFLET